MYETFYLEIKFMISRRSSRKCGFTLMEVLLVLIILVVLFALAVPTYTGMRRKGLMDAAKANIGALETAIDNYEFSVEYYPSSLDALLNPPNDLPDPSKWAGPYLKKAEGLIDPWGRPYYYMCPGKMNPNSYDLWSVGPDGIDGTNDDIGNWTTMR